MPEPINGANDNSKANNPAEDTTPTPAPEGEANGVNNAKTFTQEDVDKILSKRVNELNAKHEESTRTAIKDAIAEYERKAKMSADEKAR